MKYRPDIDGLRAIAILFVLFFHAGLSLFPSGFIGVDIFFVISGFLISGIIHDSLQTNQFSFIEFYNRRLWRMQPVFLSLILCASLITLFFYLPDDLMQFGKSARKTSLFISNNFFERITAGYFSPDSSHLPLLHTWSLSIEWQCYLILPVALYLLYRLAGQNHIGKIVGLFSLVFLGLSLYFSAYYPTKTYYHLISRIFEFLIGALVALNSYRFSFNKYSLNLLSGFAFLTLLYLGTLSDISLGFPNWYALMVCVATATLIALGKDNPETMASRLLSTKPLVFIGLISYSLYIWHWPVFVLIRYLDFKETNAVLSLAFSLIFIIAYLSWRYLEKPTRKLNHTPFGYSLMGLFILPVALTHFGAYLIKNHEGYPQRFAETSKIYETLNRYASAQRALCLQQKNTEIDKACVLGAKNPASKKGFMIGDSFSNQHWQFMDAFAKEANLSILAHATAACLALPELAQFGWYIENQVYKECLDQRTRYYNMIKANHYDVVIIGQNWGGYLGDRIINQLNDQRSYQLTQQRIEQSLDKALQIIIASGAKPVLIKSIALAKGNPHNCFFEHIKRRKKYNPAQCDYKVSEEEQRWFNELFLKMQKKYTELIIIDPQKVQCPKGLCKADIQGVPVFRDAVHLSDYASYQFAKRYLKLYKNPFIVT